MKVSIVQRHVIANEKDAADSRELFCEAARNAKITGYSHHIILGYLPGSVDSKYLAQKEAELGKSGVELYIRQISKPDAGTAFYSALNVGGPCDVKFILTADDFPIEAQKLVMDFMITKMGEEHPIVVGQRKSINLSIDANLNTRRQIHEMFMAATYPYIQLHNPFEVNLSGNTLPYKKLGDRFSGFYGINYRSARTSEILENLEGARNEADMESTFCSEYLMSSLAAKNGCLQLVAIPSMNNNVGSTRSESEVDKMISYSSKQMFTTKVGKDLISYVNHQDTIESLSVFYPPEQVHYVRNLMLRN